MINFLRRKMLVNVKGNNIRRFIKKLNVHNIEIINIEYVEDNEVNLLIYKDDFETVEKLKTIYEINDTKDYGFDKLKKIIKAVKILIVSFLLGIILFIILINIIFDVKVIHSDKNLRNLLTKELSNQGVKKYTLKKNYDELSKIKEKIIKKYPDKIEWLEIETEGVNYIVRVEERKINKDNSSNAPRNLVALKNGVIKKIINNKGETLLEKNTFVKKGETIISGEIYLNEKVMGKVRAEGEVFAEVWYTVKTTYPYTIYDEKETGKNKDVLVFNFLNERLEFTFDKFKHKNIESKTLLKNNLLPISLTLEKQKETILIDNVLTFDEALIKAEEYSIKQMESKLNSKEYIIRNKSLKSELKDSKIEIEMFFAVYEDITDYVEIGD